ncbi:MAG: hypothetical protein LWW93_13395 [Hyphomicrobiales bacterium]|nr:hypothetical protein [Hyphomicrobiales bacterium]
MRIARRSPKGPATPSTPFGATLTSVERLRERLLAGLVPVEAQGLAPRDGVGAVLATDVAFPRDEPEAPIALARGFAVRSSETIGASPYAPIELVAASPVEPGAPVEPPFDAVLRFDAATPSPAGVLVQTALSPGADLMPRGFCAMRDAPIAAAGTRLTRIAALIAAAAGLETIAVRRPHLLVLHDGEIRGRAGANALSDLLGAGLTATSIDTFDIAVPTEVDLVLLLGRGDLDPSDPALAFLRERGRVDGGGLALVGCEAVAWGEIAGRPALVLPERPEEALVAALVLIEPMIARLAGEAPTVDRVEGRLARKIVSQIGFTELAFLARDAAGAFEPLATGRPTWTAIARADAWIDLGPENEGHGEATTITARAMPFAPLRPHGATA